jgi:carbonic anhydrase
MEEAGVQVSLNNLRTFPCIRRKERDGELELTGAFFAISDGILHVLDEASGKFSPVEG